MAYVERTKHKVKNIKNKGIHLHFFFTCRQVQHLRQTVALLQQTKQTTSMHHAGLSLSPSLPPSSLPPLSLPYPRSRALSHSFALSHSHFLPLCLYLFLSLLLFLSLPSSLLLPFLPPSSRYLSPFLSIPVSLFFFSTRDSERETGKTERNAERERERERETHTHRHRDKDRESIELI